MIRQSLTIVLRSGNPIKGMVQMDDGELRAILMDTSEDPFIHVNTINQVGNLVHIHVRKEDIACFFWVMETSVHLAEKAN